MIFKHPLLFLLLASCQKVNNQVLPQGTEGSFEAEYTVEAYAPAREGEELSVGIGDTEVDYELIDNLFVVSEDLSTGQKDKKGLPERE